MRSRKNEQVRFWKVTQKPTRDVMFLLVTDTGSGKHIALFDLFARTLAFNKMTRTYDTWTVLAGTCCFFFFPRLDGCSCGLETQNLKTILPKCPRILGF